VIYCDAPRQALGKAWDGFDVRVLTRRSHLEAFFPVFLQFLLRLTPILWRTRARVWMSLDGPPLLWLALWGRLRGREVVYDSHELLLETPLVQGRPSRRLLWTCWENGGFALIRKVVTVSPAILDKLKERHPRVAFYLLPNMPFLGPAPVERKLPSADRVDLVFQGGLRVATGLPELFAAMKIRPRFRLDVYGSGPEEERLRASARAEGVEERVDFRGSVPFEQLPGLLVPA